MNSVCVAIEAAFEDRLSDYVGVVPQTAYDIFFELSSSVEFEYKIEAIVYFLSRGCNHLTGQSSA